MDANIWWFLLGKDPVESGQPHRLQQNDLNGLGKWVALRKFNNSAPEKWCLEDYSDFRGRSFFQGPAVKLCDYTQMGRGTGSSILKGNFEPTACGKWPGPGWASFGGFWPPKKERCFWGPKIDRRSRQDTSPNKFTSNNSQNDTKCQQNLMEDSSALKWCCSDFVIHHSLKTAAWGYFCWYPSACISLI